MKEKQKFYDIIEKFNDDKNRAKKELKQVIMNECKTYGEVEKYLSRQAKSAYWSGDKPATMLIKELGEDFNREKNDLSLQ
ncbi:hypothetical protein PDQ34_25995 [Bacillus cereus]|nr:hypothetical protein [Bacillus cereus]MDA2572670.1 hypothetical protein [Bacillus cereus]